MINKLPNDKVAHLQGSLDHILLVQVIPLSNDAIRANGMDEFFK